MLRPRRCHGCAAGVDVCVLVNFTGLAEHARDLVTAVVDHVVAQFSIHGQRNHIRSGGTEVESLQRDLRVARHQLGLLPRDLIQRVQASLGGIV